MRVTLEPERGCELSHLRVFYAFERMQRADAPKGGRRLAAAGAGDREGGGVGGGRIVAGRGEGGREGEEDSWSYQEATYKIIRHDGHAHHPAGSPITEDCI